MKETLKKQRDLMLKELLFCRILLINSIVLNRTFSNPYCSKMRSDYKIALESLISSILYQKKLLPLSEHKELENFLIRLYSLELEFDLFLLL